METNIKDEILGIKETVEKCLIEYPATRNSDKILFLQVLRKLGWEIRQYPNKTISLYGNYDQLPNYETIVRLRRKYQELGYYMPTDQEIINQRQKNKEIMQDINTWLQTSDK